mmetsp:Transcript_28753/g.92775  ORF Transcript_28753/g.92775 Transcript_28753/m.92775 type:complete len:121 (+) Transcript_28753:101-463(+)
MMQSLMKMTGNCTTRILYQCKNLMLIVVGFVLLISSCETSIENPTLPPLKPMPHTNHAVEEENKNNLTLHESSNNGMALRRSEIETGPDYFVNWTAMNEVYDIMEENGEEELLDDEDKYL